MIAAESAIRDWVNGKTSLVGEGNPLAGGAYTIEQRSPAEGCYAVLARAGGSADVVAEPDGHMATATVAFTVYSTGSAAAAENAAAALASQIEQLSGCPEPCGSSAVRVLVADRLTGPVHMPMQADSGEPYRYTLSAEFTLADN